MHAAASAAVRVRRGPAIFAIERLYQERLRHKQGKAEMSAGLRQHGGHAAGIMEIRMWIRRFIPKKKKRKKPGRYEKNKEHIRQVRQRKRRQQRERIKEMLLGHKRILILCGSIFTCILIVPGILGIVRAVGKNRLYDMADVTPVGQGGHVIINGAPSNQTFSVLKPHYAYVSYAKTLANGLGGKVLNVATVKASVSFNTATVNFYADWRTE